MKATILYCDRCAAEGRGNVQAALIVWIRTSLGGHTVRLDVCSEHYAMIAGQSSSANGAAPTTERTWSPRAGKRALEGTYKAALAFAAKHERFSVDDLRGALGKMPEQRVTRVLTLLVADGKLARYVQGVYQRPGFTMPAPASVELAAMAVQKLIKKHPGIRGSNAAALAGIDDFRMWRATLGYLRTNKLARTKGSKSAMRLFPT